jgi:hypothetical protein
MTTKLPSSLPNQEPTQHCLNPAADGVRQTQPAKAPTVLSAQSSRHALHPARPRLWVPGLAASWQPCTAASPQRRAAPALKRCACVVGPAAGLIPLWEVWLGLQQRRAAAYHMRCPSTAGPNSPCCCCLRQRVPSGTAAAQYPQHPSAAAVPGCCDAALVQLLAQLGGAGPPPLLGPCWPEPAPWPCACHPKKVLP